jgi:hypothetical protein
MTMKKARKESKKLMALAMTDAMRDILAVDGKLHLADERSGDAVWEWDGITWSRVPLVERDVDREAPVIDVEREEDLAVAG